MESEHSLTVIIPALKKGVAFQDDLVKKLLGVSLIQRAINKALELGANKKQIHLLTDSEEIRLIAQRNRVGVLWNTKLTHEQLTDSKEVTNYLKQAVAKSEFTLLLSPYAPLLSKELLEKAQQKLISSGKELLKPVQLIKKQVYDENKKLYSTYTSLFSAKSEIHSVESKAFVLLYSKLLLQPELDRPKILPYPISHDLLEIESYQDWWVCEKLLTRKRIIFRVIGNEQVGMGHIYRTLSLAHEISDHEILFVSDQQNTVAVNQLAGYDYWLGIYDQKYIVENIIELKPDLVINDILSSTHKDVIPLQEKGIKVINFEDLGEGAKLANLTINEMYDEPLFEGRNILWGYHYFFMRDEFNHATPQKFMEKVDTILLTFGGTDQHNLAKIVYQEIKYICSERGIHIHIVAGVGYKNYQLLKKEINNEENVTLTRKTGVISSIMEKSQLAIVSNGRTVYELAHMNIPAIVISQHKREETHKFANKNNGFIHFCLFNKETNIKNIINIILKLIDDSSYRRMLYNNIEKHNFKSNKSKVLKLIYDELSMQ
jgi:spore coat polysaccharide biosynthesis predicted glycosyltransferase SpsG|tara:strand:- start:21037 stop:22671 length:1635 start_codon:yes stop_codon:yes gene_type:complete